LIIVNAWYLYAGLFVEPFMLLLALTGIIYLFIPQLDPLMYGDLLTVQGAEHVLSADEQMQRVQAAYAQRTVTKYFPSSMAPAARSSSCRTPGVN
jgi:uncharacterized iron-regulated membrane protein